jgi:hypothetical protein
LLLCPPFVHNLFVYYATRKRTVFGNFLEWDQICYDDKNIFIRNYRKCIDWSSRCGKIIVL